MAINQRNGLCTCSSQNFVTRLSTIKKALQTQLIARNYDRHVNQDTCREQRKKLEQKAAATVDHGQRKQ
jgi:hypothetical protein